MEEGEEERGGGEEGLFQQLGVQARGASQIEQEVLDDIRGSAQGDTKDPAEQAHRELAKLQREEAAIQEALEGLGSDEQSQLRRAVGQQRLDGLQKRRKELEAQIQHEGAAGGGGQHEVHRQPPAQTLQEADDLDSALEVAGSGGVETERDRLIRTGQMTPFDNLGGYERRVKRGLERYKERARAQEEAKPRSITVPRAQLPEAEPPSMPFSHPGNRRVSKKAQRAQQRQFRANVEMHKMRMKAADSSTEGAMKMETPSKRNDDGVSPVKLPECEERKEKSARKDGTSSGEGVKQHRQGKTRISEDDWQPEDAEVSNGEGREESDSDGDQEEQMNIFQEDEAVEIEGGLKIPGRLYDSLFPYQQTGLKWLWELHCQRIGGIIGDEMGLGKTVMLLVFFSSLHWSDMFHPSLILCPATMLRQWQYELRRWAPNLQIGILHDSAVDTSMVEDAGGDRKDARLQVLSDITNVNNGVLLTTYEHLRLFSDQLLEVRWGYVVLDEGHRIRNPDAQITILAKQVQTTHRLIMSGAPIQNRLAELWSLFDFVFPGRLGTLPVFQSQFAVPIQMGGYKKASGHEVSTAYRCAVMLRDMISPYMLRRLKADVDCHLPEKSEQVLFCPLTREQREQYRGYIESREVWEIMQGRRELLQGLDVLRKISNHPDLLDRAMNAGNPNYGTTERSGKLLVAEKLFNLWEHQGHRCLIFSQTQQMLDILELLLARKGLSYRRMDGQTPVGARSRYIEQFNEDANVFAFLLTTRVGGYGINLTGADRVMIFDPDWNPSTDAQARERAWRIGQDKNVAVYRLITKGTIEEKVYHRQLYKQFLTNKVLQDPKQRKFFSSKQLSDLFSLDDGGRERDDNEVLQEAESEAKAAEDPKGSLTERSLEGDHKGEQAEAEESNETNLLKQLFENRGIHSSVNHDAVVRASDPSRRSNTMQEAERVAQQAAQALKRSRSECLQQDVDVPTWTGRSGLSGYTGTQGSSSEKRNGESRGMQEAPTIGRLSAVSSADLLTYIRRRHENPEVQASGQGADGEERDAAISLAREVVTFLSHRGGEATSATVLYHFKDRTSDAKRQALFKNVLHKVAKLKKVGSDKRVWRLRDEFAQGTTTTTT